MAITLHDKIDSGAFGDVWRATDSLDRQVAVKIIRPAGAGVSDALGHAKALARTKHPNVVTVYGIEKVRDPDTGNEVDGVVMELIGGGTLAARMRGPGFSPREAREIGFGAIDGLKHIHAQGLPHRDLHTDNIMVDGTQVKIIDILYLGTLAALTTHSQQEIRRGDLVRLRLVLQELLFHSVLDRGEITEFSNLLHTSSDIDAIRIAFSKVTDPHISSDEQRFLDHAYRRATDENFVEGDDYASALMGETPRRVVLPLLKRLIEERSFHREHSAYVRMLWSVLKTEEIGELIDILNTRLEEDTPGGTWWPNLRLVARLREDVWHRLSAVVRLKLEDMIVNDILSGWYDTYGGGMKSGYLGSYVFLLWNVFSDRSRVIDNVESMLKQSWFTQNYIGEKLLTILPALVETPEERRRLINGIAAAIKNGAKVVVKRLSELPDDWVKEAKEKASEQVQ